jgi:hypothetical protein
MLGVQVVVAHEQAQVMVEVVVAGVLIKKGCSFFHL